MYDQGALIVRFIENKYHKSNWTVSLLLSDMFLLKNLNESIRYIIKDKRKHTFLFYSYLAYLNDNCSCILT